eukprot:COSAG03_NODE_2912_length_2359_cov_2.132743_4_plen_373_part_01
MQRDATTRSAVLQFVSATSMRLKTAEHFDLKSCLSGSRLTAARLNDQRPTWDLPAQCVLGASLVALPEPLRFVRLTLRACALGPLGLEPLLAVARRQFVGTGLKRIDVSMNPALGDTGMAILAAALPQTLRSLAISGCAVGDNGICALVGKLPDGLRHLDCSLNRAVSVSGWGAVGNGLRRLPKLESLVLKGCQMGDGSVAALANHLPVPTALASIDLEANDLGLSGARSLAAILSHCVSLRQLYVGQNFGMGVAGGRALEEAVRRCPWAAEFDLQAAHETDEDAMEEMMGAAQQMAPVLANLGAENLQSIANIMAAMVPGLLNSGVLPAAAAANLQPMVNAMLANPQQLQVSLTSLSLSLFVSLSLSLSLSL